MSRRGLTLVALASMALPAGVGAQCGIDLIDVGIRAYRNLELERAQELFRDAIAVNQGASQPCATEDARALMYLGASQWLLQRPDSAWRAFELAVIEAPLFQPDAFEFPPEITDAFDDVRQGTSAVAVTRPAEVEIGPRGDDALAVRLMASTDHWVTVIVKEPGGDPIRAPYRGLVPTAPSGLVVEWDGRRSGGAVVTSGPYEIEIISEDRLSSRPVRKVVIPLSVESDAPVGPPSLGADSVGLSGPAVPAPRGGGVWSAVATAGAGLLGGALVFGVPPAIDGLPASGARYAVGGSLGLAGIIGFVQRLRQGRPDAPPAAPVIESPPTLRIRAGYELRLELGEEGSQRSGGPPPAGR
jgi:hypothetical protein